MNKMLKKKNTIPDPHDDGALTVTDGQEIAGSIVERDHSFFAFDNRGRLVGEYGTCAEAMQALPKSK